MKKTLASIGPFFLILIITLSYSMAANEIDVKDTNGKLKNAKHITAKELVIKGNSAYRSKHYDEAIVFYKQAIAENPQSIDAHYDLGITYKKKNMYDEAIDTYKQVISLDPNHAKAHNNLGIVYERKRLFKEALAEYKVAVEISPNLAPAQYNLGRAYFKEGQREKAAEHLYNAGLLFLKAGDKNWATNAYKYLKRTKSEDLEKSLYEKLNPQMKDQNQ